MICQTEVKDEWRTPNTERQPIINLVKSVFGDDIWLDPTSDDAKWVPAIRHFTRDQNCLTQTWWGYRTVYMNPPFSNPLPFVRKLVQEYEAHNIKEAIALLKSGTVHNKGTGHYIRRSVSAGCWWGVTQSRIAFVNSDDKVQPGADFDCVILYWGEQVDKFAEVFDNYGSIFTPYRRF